MVAIDSVAAKLMGFDKDRIEHIKYCGEKGLGTMDFNKIDILGDEIKNLHFIFIKPKRNLVAFIEETLRNLPFRKLFFETNLLNIFCFGAKIYYYFWYNLLGKKYRDFIIKKTVYGEQWRDIETGFDIQSKKS